MTQLWDESSLKVLALWKKPGGSTLCQISQLLIPDKETEIYFEMFEMLLILYNCFILNDPMPLPAQ